MTEPASPAEPAMPDPSSRLPVVWPVLREMFSLLRRHWLRILIFTFAILLSTGVSRAVLATVLYLPADYRTAIPLLTHYGVMALWVVLQAVWGPLQAGYLLTLHRLLGGEKAGVRTLVACYCNGRLFWRLAAGLFVLTVSHDALRTLWTYLPWEAWFGNFVAPDSPLFGMLQRIPASRWFTKEFHVAIQAMILLPIQWTLLEIIVSGKSWPKALAASAGLAWRHKRLALAFLAVSVALSFHVWLRVLLPNPWAYAEDYGELVTWLFAVQVVVNLAITLAIIAIEATALVVVYQAMLRREAAAPDGATPPESA